MASIQIKEDENKVLRDDITPEFFNKDHYMAIRFKIVSKSFYKKCLIIQKIVVTLKEI